MLLALSVSPVGDVAVLRSYLGESEALEADLRRTLDAAVAQCSTYTGRTLGQVEQMAVTDWVDGSVVKVPDVRVLTSVEVLDGPHAGVVDLEMVEPLWSFPHPWLRLPIRLARARVRVTGEFGMHPMPVDLLDSIYAMAARKWREKDANYADTVVHPDGSQDAYYRQLPASVKAAWDAWKLPDPPVVSVQVARG